MKSVAFVFLDIFRARRNRESPTRSRVWLVASSMYLSIQSIRSLWQHSCESYMPPLSNFRYTGSDRDIHTTLLCFTTSKQHSQLSSPRSFFLLKKVAIALDAQFITFFFGTINFYFLAFFFIVDVARVTPTR